MKKVALLLIPLILTACSFAPVKPQQTNTYTLNNVSREKLSKFPSFVTLLVLRPTAASGYQNKNMYYQLKPHELRPFSRNRWIDSPAQMVLPLLVQSLQNSNYYHAVVAAPFSGEVNYRLAININNFYQDFIPKQSQFVMTTQATLVNNKNNHIIATKEFSATIPAIQNDPYGGVIAANKATQQILQKIVRFCVKNS